MVLNPNMEGNFKDVYNKKQPGSRPYKGRFGQAVC